MRRLLLSLLALSALAACKKQDQGSGAPAANANGPIVIGEVGSMTGTEATFGLSSANGIQLAIDELNSKGGVKGRQLQVKVLDDHWTAVTVDGRLSAHFEHSVAITEKGPFVLSRA